MTTRLVSLGYTGEGWLDVGYDYKKLMMPSCSLSFETTPMVSNSVFQFAREAHNIRRTKSAYINDVPKVNLSITFDPEHDFLKQIISFIVRRRNTKMRFKYMDKDNGIQWLFEEIYLSGLNFTVSEHTILTLSLSFFVLTDSIFYEWKELEMNKIGNNTIAPIRTPVGYYRWKLLYGQNRKEVPDVTEFNFGFAQEVKPQYECSGKNSRTAPSANDILFGLPSITFGYSQTMHTKDGSIYDDVLTQMNQPRNLEDTRMHFQLYDAKNKRYDEIFDITGVKELSSTPSLVGNSFKVIRRECAVYGAMEVNY